MPSDTQLEDFSRNEGANSGFNDVSTTHSLTNGSAEMTLNVNTLQRAAALWILKTREVNRIPYSTMERIISDLQSLLHVVVSEFKDRIEERVQEITLTSTSAEDLIRLVSDELVSSNPLLTLFSGLETQYRQTHYFKKNFNLIVSLIAIALLIKILIFS